MLSVRLAHNRSNFTLHVDAVCHYPVTAVFGPSGSGKSTLLDLVAGLLRPDWGEIRIDDDVVFSSASGIDLPPEKRGIGYVFQDDLLFPHLTVEKNLRYGYHLQKPDNRRFEINRIVDLLQLRSLLNRSSGSLSVGERQRVAMGRALLTSPRLLLMDEPLASLDQGLKDRIIPYLRHIRSDLGIPVLYVSHSVAEILELTGQVIVLKEGKMVAHGDFFDIAHHPDILPLVEAHGFENVLPVEVISGDATGGVSIARFAGQNLKIPYCDRPPGGKIFIGIRADDIILSREVPSGLSVRNTLEGRVLEVSKVEGRGLIYVDVGKRLAVKITPEAIEDLGLEVNQTISCLIKTHSIRIGPEVE